MQSSAWRSCTCCEITKGRRNHFLQFRGRNRTFSSEEIPSYDCSSIVRNRRFSRNLSCIVRMPLAVKASVRDAFTLEHHPWHWKYCRKLPTTVIHF